jgi:hypothetical protein
MQRGLEQVYRLNPSPDVRGFIVGDAQRQRLGLERLPREQLLLCQDTPDELEIGLFMDPKALANLAQNDPRNGLGEHNFEDFCLAVEGVSHFVYVLFRATADVPVSALELELQAEVDKFVSALLLHHDAAPPAQLRHALYERFQLADDLSREEQERYRIANDGAARYTRSLEARFIGQRRIPDMLAELRRFYRLTLADKLDLIRDAA